jgi:GNAT superfamily N-acetyltransferase
MPAGRWFRNATQEPPEEIRDADKFAVMEWMVRQAYRRTGVGRALLATLLTLRTERWAILAANPTAPARQIYWRLGRQECGQTEPDMLPRMDVLALELRSATST